MSVINLDTLSNDNLKKFIGSLTSLDYVYDEYAAKFQEFRSYPDKIENSFYSIKFVLESDVQIWVERLMSPGFSIKPGITLLFDTVTPREAFETVIHTKLNSIKGTLQTQKTSH